jgi:hypothetical protein
MGIIETLQAEIQALKDRVERLESKWAQEEVEEATRQLTRDDIIEMAKRDVAELKNDDGFYVVEDFYDCYADFKVNSEKRMVVALMRGKHSGKVYERGIAKCHPDDCFNAAIGRAIALRRALGLEVPNEYLNAPQPTEVRVGDIIEYKGKRYTVLKAPFKNGQCGVNSIAVHNGKIIDDSRADAGQEV